MASHFQLRDCITSVSLPCVINLEIVLLLINTYFQTFANAIAETTKLMTRYTKNRLVSTKELKRTEHTEAINYTGIVPDQKRTCKSIM